MRISDEQLSHLELLARVELDDDERESMRRDLSRVLDYFELLSELDTDGVEELVRPVPLSNVLRRDEVEPSLPREIALRLAVETRDGFFQVPRTVQDED